MEVPLATIKSLYDSERLDEVATALDQLELEEPLGFTSPQWPHAVHLLAHIYATSIEDARFVYKRTPDSIKQNNPELLAAFALLQRMWTKDYAEVWNALQFDWSPLAQPLVAAVAEKTRRHMVDLVGRAYASISLGKMALLLGCSEAEAAQVASGKGWEVADSGMVDVKQPPPAARSGEAAAQLAMQRLSEYVVHLET